VGQFNLLIELLKYLFYLFQQFWQYYRISYFTISYWSILCNWWTINNIILEKLPDPTNDQQLRR